jgi:predicted nucleotidyltransferase
LASRAGLGDLLKKSLSGVKDIRYALIFGSFASGEETETSDVDVLIIGHADEEEILKAISKAEEELGREINYILWSEKEFKGRIKSRHHLLAEITQKNIIMLIGDEHEFRRTFKE